MRKYFVTLAIFTGKGRNCRCGIRLLITGAKKVIRGATHSIKALGR